MSEIKEQKLEQTYQTWLDLCMGNELPLDLIDTLVSPNIMGYGTTVEEKVFGRDGIRNLISIGREQSKMLEDMQFERNKVFRQFLDNENVTICVDEFLLFYKTEGAQHKIPLRVSTILSYQNDDWMVQHWHGSVGVETEEGDTWHKDQLAQKNRELQQLVDERTAELKQSLEDLKQTQEQLIHSEKMASLGELTAGIAHEIQNPLNFVNNFSEVNKELIQELKEEHLKPEEERDRELEEELLFDIYQNLEKIIQHGKRADSIVKGMLLHSRKSEGERQLTDINSLADEYLRLAFHGLRAKDKSFNSNLITDFDASIGQVEVMPQELGRVILNLINNAFYAVKERDLQEEGEYQPTIWVGSKKISSEKIAIYVKDNGKGIPEAVRGKIFQPFFTTKPSGKGTGLGLSLSYDIVKAHGGNLELSSEEGTGTEFIISIPIDKKL